MRAKSLRGKNMASPISEPMDLAGSFGGSDSTLSEDSIDTTIEALVKALSLWIWWFESPL
jgi:hypothetical protein